VAPIVLVVWKNVIYVNSIMKNFKHMQLTKLAVICNKEKNVSVGVIH